MTPAELTALVEADAWRHRRSRHLAVLGAWATETFARVRDLPRTEDGALAALGLVERAPLGPDAMKKRMQAWAGVFGASGA